MQDIALTESDLKELCKCQALLSDILAAQQHTYGDGLEVPKAIVETWEKVKEQCDLLCRDWQQASKNNKMSPQLCNIDLFSPAKSSIRALKSAIERERMRKKATDDVHFREEMDKQVEKHGIPPNEQRCRRELMQDFEKVYPKTWTVAPGVEAHRALSKLLELTREKFWVAKNDLGLGTLIDECELKNRDRLFNEHMQEVGQNLKPPMKDLPSEQW